MIKPCARLVVPILACLLPVACGPGARTAPSVIPQANPNVATGIESANTSASQPYLFVFTHQLRVVSGFYLGTPNKPIIRVTHLAGQFRGHMLAYNASGDIFLPSYAGPLEYRPPYTGSPVTIPAPSTITNPGGLSVDSAQNLFVTVGNAVLICPKPYASCSTAMTPAPYEFLADTQVSPNGTIFAWVASYQNFGPVYALARPYTAAPTPVQLPSNSFEPFPDALGTDANADLFISQSLSFTAGRITEFAPPYTGKPVATITNSVPGAIFQMIFDSNNDMFVSGGVQGFANTEVQEYAPPYTGAPIATISLPSPTGIALDKDENLYVADDYLQQVRVYAPPYHAAPFRIISNGINGFQSEPLNIMVVPKRGPVPQ